MVDGESLTNREFIGTILPKKSDAAHQGKYRVNIPVLQPHMKENEGIWCKNHINKYRVTPSMDGIYGSYYPLHPGTSVIVKFFANHIESAYIDRIISDAYTETLPYEIIERDDYYQIIRTPRYNNLIAIYEGPPPPPDADGNEQPWTIANAQPSKNIPKNSIHIYYNETKTVVVIDENGVHIITADNVDIKSAKVLKIESVGDININSGAKINIQAVGDINIKSGAKINEQASSDININSGAKINEQSVGDINIKSGGSIKNQAAVDIGIKASGNNFIEAGSNHLKGSNIGMIPTGSAGAAPSAGSAIEAAPAVPVVIPDLIATGNDYKYFKKSSGG